ncbi:MAG: membrane fusion protein (multidrug efflux system) [Desulforhopalus sp.]|jgi:membrane fusion protein (multidrug efflux system)
MYVPTRLRGVFFFFFFLSFLVSDFYRFPVVYGSEYITPKPYERTTLLTGFTRPRQVINVSSEVSGKCIAVYAEVGNPIPPPGILADIDDTYIRLDFESNRLERERVQRQLVTEKKMLQRYTTLREKNSATQAKLDEVKLSADLHELAIQGLNNKHQRLSETLDRHKIKVPEGWLLIERMIEAGEYVQPGQSIAKLGDFKQLIIPFALSFTEMNALKKRKSITLFLPDLNIQTTARIYRISPAYVEATKKISIELIIDNKKEKSSAAIRGGLRAELKIRLKETKSTFILPFSSVINRYDAYWVVNEQEERIKVIYLGTTDDGVSAIVSAPELSETDKLFKRIPADF